MLIILCSRPVRLHAMVSGMCVDGFLTLKEFFGVFCSPARTSEVVDFCNVGAYCVAWFWNTIASSICLVASVCTIFSFAWGVCVALIICACGVCASWGTIGTYFCYMFVHLSVSYLILVLMLSLIWEIDVVLTWYCSFCFWTLQKVML